MYGQILPVLVPVFLITLLGAAWAWLRVPFQRDFLTAVVMNVGVPCLILNGTAQLHADPRLLFHMMGYAVVALAGSAIVGATLLSATRQPLRSYLPAVSFGNTGNLGLPLCLFAFGQTGLGLAIGFYLVNSVAQFCLAPLLQGREPVLRTLLTTPVIYAAVIGLGLLGTGTALPLWLANTVGLLAGMAIPLMMLALGHSLGSIKVRHLKVAAGIAVTRLVPGLLVAIAIITAFDLHGITRGVVLLQSSMPVAVFCYLLAARYDRHPEDVASAILVSTLAAFAMLPFLLWFALSGVPPAS